MKNLKCLVIGSTNIAKIHIREMIRNNINKISVVSRKKSKSKNFANELDKQFNLKFKNFDHSVLKERKFNFISICSNSKYHVNNLEKIPKQNTKILIEKPIINLNRNTNYLIKLKSLYKKHKNIFVSYPMFYFAQSFIHKFKFNNKKIKSIDIYYQTKGKHKSREIFLDLAPHAFAFIFSVCNERFIKDFILNKFKHLDNKVICEGLLNDTYFNIIFIQDPKKTKSNFRFSINGKNFTRVTKVEKNNFANYIKFKNKIIEIENPMKQVIRNFVRSRSLDLFKKNKELTYLITEITKKIYDKSF